MWRLTNWVKRFWRRSTLPPAAQQLESALIAAGLGAKAAALVALSKPSIRLRTQPAPDDDLPKGASKLGGYPDLPTQMAWPFAFATGAPLAFLAQIRLDEVAPYDAAHLLPTAGLLSFFYDARGETYGDQPTDRGNWQVLFYDGDLQQLQRTKAPAALPTNAVYPTCTATFTTEWTLPLDPTLETPAWVWAPGERDRYEQWLATYPTPADHAALHHRLLGHADTLQDDMRAQCQLLTHGVRSIDDPQAAALLAQSNQWQLLFQIDSDEQARMRWSNNGLLYYWIEKAKLQRREFDNVWLILQSE